MHAAIKCIEDTLLIRRLQAREFSHETDGVERIVAIHEDIASLERGLQALEANGKLCPDLEFLARMLHEVVVVQGYKANFHICEAWEVAKKYLPSSEKIGNQKSKIENPPKCPTIGDPGQNRPEAV
ncbi:MAG: hypothetical protein NT011_13515 [Kiritimatiellaeota bacterium]|nr:hypothetical protein [Kiritimatiellota bacterium]